jgi:NadR type nicotinamide-nucleotide adenylyltransferase
MWKPERQIRIAITGPESTGKTTLAKQLAKVYEGQYIHEYAREYIEGLPQHYTFKDIEHIAGIQAEQYKATRISSRPLFFFDTWLIITKVWFKWVFQKTPDWLDDEIRNCRMDLFLLCAPDLPWEPDAVRENGGENRKKLYEEYRSELIHYGFPFAEIEGTGDERLYSAIAAIRKQFGNT